jgi:signal transduction histidine kinase/CheY-like chemotaxis protein
MTAGASQRREPFDALLPGRLAVTLPIGVKPSSTGLQCTPSGAAPEERQSCRTNPAAEVAALVALAKALGEAPDTVCQALADNALGLLNAGSAGISVLTVQSDGSTLVSWPAIAGRWQAQSGCSRLLNAPAATLEPAGEHCLVVPFGVAGTTAGTVWAVAHDAASVFDAEDLRTLQHLALFAAPALKAAAARGPASPTHPATPTLQPRGAANSQHATFNGLIEKAPFGVYVIDEAFHLCQASAAARKAFASVHPLIGTDFGDIVRAVWPEPFASDVLAHFRHTLASGEAHAEPTVSELRKDTPDIESYDWKIERIVLPDGAYGVVCYFYDLTERQQAAEALRLRTAQFETLVNDAPLGIYLVDAQLRIRQINPLALPEFGNIEDPVGRDLVAVMQTLWGPARADEIVQQFQHTLDTGEPYEVAELIGLRVDLNTTACYEWQIHRIPLPDGSQGAVCYLRDIATRVRAQAQIRESEMRFRAFVTASSDVVYRMSPDWREMRHLNGRNFVADTDAPSVQWMQDYIPPQDQPQVLAAINAAIEAKCLFELEHRVLRVNGELGWTQSRAVPLLDADGEIVEWIGTATDVTDRKAIEADLIAALAAAETASQAKSNFLLQMSHELRSPLSSILGFAQLIEGGQPPPAPAQQDNVKQILNAGWYLLGLINEILDLTAIESGNTLVASRVVCLADVLDDCQAMIAPQAQRSGIQVEFPVVDRSCRVLADPVRTKQVLINLLTNAIKYNRAAGRVAVRCSAAPTQPVRISVEDTGQGLTPAQLEKLFEPFNRLGQELGSEAGTGIGLVICKRLVELMGGRMSAISTAGVGSTFWFELEAAIRAPLRPADTPVRTVLCIGESTASWQQVAELVALRPATCLLRAGDIASGMAMARSARPDAILMGLHLQDPAGLDARLLLARDPVTAHIPVIALSDDGAPGDVPDGLPSGCVGYLSQPLQYAAFAEALDLAFQPRQTGGQRATA